MRFRQIEVLHAVYTPPPHPRLTRTLRTEGELVAFGPSEAFGKIGGRLPPGELAGR